MVNYSYVNLSDVMKNPDCSLSWNQALNDYCTDWKQYLQNYDFYIGCIWVFLIAGLIKNFWNFTYYNYFYIDKHKIEIDFNLMEFIQNIAIGALIIRIFQLYYISKIYLGF